MDIRTVGVVGCGQMGGGIAQVAAAAGYSVVVMVWDRNQGTPLHDHAGVWCVECVYRGRIRVTSFDLENDAGAEVLKI